MKTQKPETHYTCRVEEVPQENMDGERWTAYRVTLQQCGVKRGAHNNPRRRHGWQIGHGLTKRAAIESARLWLAVNDTHGHIPDPKGS